MPTKKLDHDSYIYERVSDDGRLTGYQVKIRRAGFPDFTKTFDDLAEARTAVNRVLADQSRGHRFNPLLAERKTLGDVIRAGLEALKNGERVVKGRSEEISRLRGFLLRETALCAHAMAHIDYEMMEDWKQQRLEEVSAGTVKRELTQLRGIFADAARKLHLVCSPLIHVKSPTVMDAPRVSDRQDRPAGASRRSCSSDPLYQGEEQKDSVSRSAAGAGAGCSRPYESR